MPLKNVSRPYILAVVFYVLLLSGIVVLANLRSAPWIFTVSGWLPFGDKICHLILMGLFSFFVNSALRCRTVSLGRVRILLGSLCVGFLVLAEEVSQFWIATRNLELWDLVFDVTGIYLFGLLAKWNIRNRTNDTPNNKP